MTTRKNLRDELLKHDGANERQADEFRDKILKRDEARVARTRKAVIVAWAVVVAGLLGAAATRVLFPDLEEFRPELVLGFIAAFQGLLLIAVFLTVSLYLRSRTLTTHQIQASLAQIEEHLRKMASKE